MNILRKLGTLAKEWTVGLGSILGKIKLLVTEGSADYTLTLTNTALTANRTITFPDSTGTVALTSSNHTQNTDTGTTGNTFTVDSDSVTGKIVLDVALGSADKTLTLTNAALTDNRTITFPNATGTVMLVPTPVAEILDELTTLTHEAPSSADYAIASPVQNTGFGFSTADEMNTALSVIANNQARIKAIEGALVSLGLLTDAD